MLSNLTTFSCKQWVVYSFTNIKSSAVEKPSLLTIEQWWTNRVGILRLAMSMFIKKEYNILN